MHGALLFRMLRRVARGFFLAVVGVAPLLCATARAASVKLAWIPSTDPYVVEYHLYYGPSTKNYTNMVRVGVVTNATLAGMVSGATYFVAATAFDSVGQESDYSAEISFQVPVNLVVAADSLSRVYGAANPTLTGALTGVQTGDNITATYSTTATQASPVGTYSIVPTLIDPSGKLANYNVTTNSGTLTIQPATSAAVVGSSSNPSLPGEAVTFTAALSAVTPSTGLPTGTVQFIIDGLAAGSPAALSGGAATYITAALGHGAHTVVAQYAGDGNFFGATNGLSGVQVVNTPPAPGAGATTYDATSGAKLSFAALLSAASDADGDPVAVAGVAVASANGGSVSTNGGWIFYVPASGYTNTDTLSYTLSDGYAAPVTGTVTLSPRSCGDQSSNLTVSDLGNGSYGVSGGGVPGRAYRLQSADDAQAANWQALGAVVADQNGWFGFTDPGGSPQRHYRSVWP